MAASRGLFASIAILEAHDVVLAEVFAALHFDEYQVFAPGVFKTVLGTRRDISRFVRRHFELGFAVDDLGRAADHDPMFATMVVHLQREGRARLHDDALDLEPGALLDDGIGAPGPENGAVKLVAFMAPGLELAHDLLHILSLRAVSHQYSILGI